MCRVSQFQYFSLIISIIIIIYSQFQLLLFSQRLIRNLFSFFYIYFFSSLYVHVLDPLLLARGEKYASYKLLNIKRFIYIRFYFQFSLLKKNYIFSNSLQFSCIYYYQQLARFKLSYREKNARCIIVKKFMNS